MEKNGMEKEKNYNYNGNLIFEGKYLNGERNGKGKEYNYDGKLKFEGEYLNGERWNGKGKEYNNDGKLIFEGEYIKEKRNGIINGKLNICFEENRENKDINIDMNKTPEKKFEVKDDQDLLMIKMSNERKNISNVNKRNNEAFIKRIKDNENFIKRNNIIISEEGKRSKSLIVKKKSEEIAAHPKLKLYNLKGAFLNKKKK